MSEMIHKFEKPAFSVTEDETHTSGTFIVEPLEKGFGLTLGNALRRVLLSAIPGASVFAVRIEGASHEFCALDGVVEDVTQIILNLKELILEIDGNDEETREITVDAHGPCTVYARDLIIPSDVEVINGDLPIATLTEDGNLKMTIYACNGRGYVTCDENRTLKNVDTKPGVIATDSNYSPIVRVNYSVDSARVGHDSRYDKLTLYVTTKGSIKPSEAVETAAGMLIGHFEKFTEVGDLVNKKELNLFKEKVTEEVNKNADIDLIDLPLSMRSYNALKRHGYTKVGQLTELTEEDLMAFRNLGKKSLKEIEDNLNKLGLGFKKTNL